MSACERTTDRDRQSERQRHRAMEQEWKQWKTEKEIRENENVVTRNIHRWRMVSYIVYRFPLTRAIRYKMFSFRFFPSRSRLPLASFYFGESTKVMAKGRFNFSHIWWELLHIFLQSEYDFIFARSLSFSSTKSAISVVAADTIAAVVVVEFLFHFFFLPIFGAFLRLCFSYLQKYRTREMAVSPVFATAFAVCRIVACLVVLVRFDIFFHCFRLGYVLVCFCFLLLPFALFCIASVHIFSLPLFRFSCFSFFNFLSSFFCLFRIFSGFVLCVCVCAM